MELQYKNSTDNNVFTTVSFAADDVDYTDKLCECKIDVDPLTKTWTISSWYTTEGHKHHGFGKLTLQKCLDTISSVYGTPDIVEYIWNGANQYVFDWLEENFGALSKCPIAVQKYASDDDWESHIYILNREKFLKYFSIEDAQDQE